MVNKRRLAQNHGLLTSKAESVIETKALTESKGKTSVTLLFLQDILCSVAVTFSPCEFLSQVLFCVTRKQVYLSGDP